MEVPRLVIVTGPPASGKSALAEDLARELTLPLLAKDDVKLALYRSLGAPDQAASGRMGEAAFEILFSLAERLLEAGVGLVVDGNFVRGQSEAALAPLVARSAAVQLHCAAGREETLRRYSARVRHPMHFDEANLPRVTAGLDSGRHEPLALPVPTLRVDTTAGYQPALEAILDFARRETGA
jgi:predicted kinase